MRFTYPGMVVLSGYVFANAAQIDLKSKNNSESSLSNNDMNSEAAPVMLESNEGSKSNNTDNNWDLIEATNFHKEKSKESNQALTILDSDHGSSESSREPTLNANQDPNQTKENNKQDSKKPEDVKDSKKPDENKDQDSKKTDESKKQDSNKPEDNKNQDSKKPDENKNQDSKKPDENKNQDSKKPDENKNQDSKKPEDNKNQDSKKSDGNKNQDSKPSKENSTSESHSDSDKLKPLLVDISAQLEKNRPSPSANHPVPIPSSFFDNPAYDNNSESSASESSASDNFNLPISPSKPKNNPERSLKMNSLDFDAQAAHDHSIPLSPKRSLVKSPLNQLNSLKFEPTDKPTAQPTGEPTSTTTILRRLSAPGPRMLESYAITYQPIIHLMIMLLIVPHFI